MLPMLIVTFNFSACGSANSEPLPAEGEVRIVLPEPRYNSNVSLEEALLKRRSIRDYTSQPLTLEEVAQLLWAAQGVTSPSGFRAAPSAGATCPLEVYVVIGNVEGVAPGIYKYEPEAHQLLKVVSGERRRDLARAALSEEWVAQGAISIVITTVYERTTGRYGRRGIRYVDMEAGHAAQNIYLQAVALNLGTVVIGAFYDNQVAKILELPEDEVPLYIMPVSRIRE